MGFFASQYLDAGRGPEPHRADDPVTAHKGAGLLTRCVWVLLWLCTADITQAETLRVATFAAPLSRDGPGLLLRDIQKGDSPEIIAIQDIIAHTAPDILALTDFDYDLDGLALAAFAASFADPYPHVFALRPNAGMATGLDLDANGRLGEARDAQGYGRFAGDGGMAILSRFPIMAGQVTDLSDVLWKDLPDATLPQIAGKPFLNTEVQARLRLSSAGHWIVPVAIPDGPPLAVMIFDATPPVFDAEEDMNGLRNRDELRLWDLVLDGRFGPAPQSFVIAGNANLDPNGGDGYRQAMVDFLALASLQDPLPDQPTADWPDDGAGDLRVSYVLPSHDWRIVNAGIFWPGLDDPDRVLLGDDGLAAGPHRLVWVDIDR